MPTTKFIRLLTALIPDDEFPFVPAVAELVDVDEAPDAVPDAEVDELELEDGKVATGCTETLLQVPPMSSFNILVKDKASYLTARRSAWVVRQERNLAACSQLNQCTCRSTICSERIFYN